ncbi:MAG: LLM class flavin-dependent oxidoreductase [Chloroflexota bacterium]
MRSSITIYYGVLMHVGYKRFGAFIPPFHSPAEDPSRALARDMELVCWLDSLAYDEAWVGEHHSAGWEYLSSPELFLAVAAERTRHINLGTGVVSLPYHHPFMVAERMSLLDNLTRGRVLFGVGPGSLVTDALMLGIDPTRTRPMMDEALGVILRLFTETQPITMHSDWFTLRDAVLQLRPYTKPYMPLAVASMQSPAGPALAGKYGAAMLSMGVFSGLRGAVDLKAQWRVAEEAAAAAGQIMRREDWRLVVNVHLGETRAEAMNAIRAGATAWLTQYQRDVLSRPLPESVPEEHAVETLVDSGSWIVGSPDDCIAGIQRLDELSGGFGGFLVMVQDWASFDAQKRSYELLARYVMPRFRGALIGVQGSYTQAANTRDRTQQSTRAAIESAFVQRATSLSAPDARD